MKTVLRILVAIVAFIMIMCMAPSEWALSEVVPIPVDKMVMNKINPKYYVSDLEYEDPSLHVVIKRDRYLESNYVVAYVDIADASQIRSYRPGNGTENALGSTLAARVNAVLAINGDFYPGHREGESKYILCQGKIIRKSAYGFFDQMGINDKGDFVMFPLAKTEDFETYEGTLINTFSFGPILVKDGVAVTDFKGPSADGVGANKNTQRMCIAQLGPLSYMCVAVEGPEDPGSTGITLNQFVELITSLGDVQQAYNLDGGSSCTVVFKNEKINSPDNPKKRWLWDIIYFASAWEE